jgi:hypothetical protein
MYKDRLRFYRELEILRGSKLLVYVTGDRQGMETQIHSEVLDKLVEHLDGFGKTEKITLILHSRGGETAAGWSIAKLLRSFCEDLEIIIPARAHSAATLISLSANRLIMTKQATLGPIDPSINSPINPEIPGAGPTGRFPVSVESIKGYVDLARDEFGVKSSGDMTKVLAILAEKVHPLVLGNVFRIRSQIRMLARRLLEVQFNPQKDRARIEKIVEFLCAESGSHDYTINAQEARDELKLPIEEPTGHLYEIIRAIYSDIAEELEFVSGFNQQALLASAPESTYSCKRALIESCEVQPHVFVSEGIVRHQIVPTPQGPMPAIQDQRTFEGWRRVE